MNDFLATNLQLLVSGFLAGGNYALVALGLVIIHKPTGVINFGHGDIGMLGAYVAVVTLIQYHLAPYVSILILLPLGFLLGGLIGLFLNIPLRKGLTVSIIMGSLGVGMILQASMILKFGGTQYYPPPLISADLMILGPLRIVVGNLYGIAITFILMLGMFAFFQFTDTGVAMRAVAQNQEGARLRGVSPNLVVFFSWGIASVFGMFSTFLLSSQLGAHPFLGAFILAKAFTSAVIGGLNNLGGTIAGAFLLAVLDTFIAGYLGADFQIVGTFLICLLVLLVRPQGLFLRGPRARLA